MIAFVVILLILLLIFAVPYGVDIRYEEETLRLGIKAGFIRLWLLPQKPKTAKQLERKRRREEKKQAKKAARAAAKGEKDRRQVQTVKPKQPLDLPFLFALIKMGLRAIRRVFRSFSIDYLCLYYVVATSDPYDTAVEYSYVSAALAAVPEIAGDIVRIRKKDIQLGMDFTREKPIVSGRIVISLQLYKIVCVAVAFAVEYLRWKKIHRDPVGTDERKDQYGREQDQRTDGCNHEQDQTAC